MNKEIQILPLLIVFAVGMFSGIGIYSAANQAFDLGLFSNISHIEREVLTNTALQAADFRRTIDISEPLTYEEAMKEFEGKRFQFAPNCIPVTTSMVVKNGTIILLDNRSADGIEVTIDGVIHRLWGYEFKAVMMRSNQLPHTAVMNCRSGEDITYNSVQVLIQE